MINTVSVNSNNLNTLFKNNQTFENNQEISFQSLLNIKNYDENLQNVLSSLNDIEKEVHIKTLAQLEGNGYSKAELNIINIHLLFKKENKLEELELTEENKELIDKYSSLFKELEKVIKEKRESELRLKPLQSSIFMTDTLLKSKDLIDGVNSQKHILNIEI